MSLVNPYFDLHDELADLSAERQLALRKKLIWAYSWAIPNEQAVRALAARGPTIELGAGTGYWAWLVAQAGGSVVAYDCAEPQAPHWVAVTPGDASVLAHHVEAAQLFLCWPPFEDPLAARCIRAFTGERVAYVGEWRGRTGDLEFHDLLESEFRVEQEVAIPCWPGFKDMLYLMRRR